MDTNAISAGTLAASQFARDFPEHVLWSDPLHVRTEPNRFVVGLLFKPRGVPLLPAPSKYYEVALDLRSCRQLNDDEAKPYWPKGPRK